MIQDVPSFLCRGVPLFGLTEEAVAARSVRNNPL